MQVIGKLPDESPVVEITKESVTYRVTLKNGQHIAFWNAFEQDEWEPRTFVIFSRFLNREHSYVDLGGWIGPTVLYGAKRAKHCYVVEPDPVAGAALKENIALNELSNVSLFEGAISDTCGKVQMCSSKTPGDSESSMVASEKAYTWEVPCLTLREFFKRSKIEDCSFVKIDIEGGEVLVVPEAREFLAEFRPTLHLSLHPSSFPNAKSDMVRIIETLKMYKNCYFEGGHRFDAAKLENMTDNCGVVVTDEEW